MSIPIIRITDDPKNPNSLKSYYHRVTLTTNASLPLFKAIYKIVTGNWVLLNWFWIEEVNEKGETLFNYIILYAQTNIINQYAKVPAADRLELIRLGMLPLDKLREISNANR